MVYPDDFIDKIICGDCLEVMKDIPDESMDLIIADPEWQNFDELILMTLRTKLKDGRHIFMYWHSFTAFMIQPKFEELFNFLNIIIAVRKNFCSGRCSKKYSLPLQWYPIFFGAKNDPIFDISKRKFDLKLATDVWEYTLPQSNFVNEPKLHPWQKDIATTMNMISLCSDENEVILDPFLGSGTTAVACKQLNRHYIGIEINPDYCKIARERLMGVPDSLFKDVK